VRLHNRFKELGWLVEASVDNSYNLTPNGFQSFAALGIDVDAARALRRRFAYPCLDWSERQPHVGGSLAAALLKLALKRRWVSQELDSRALRVTNLGRREVLARFGLDLQIETGNVLRSGTR
jgi:hypothetical protein